jgi:uncharacterized membrane protein YkvA (DUF1232 family)
MSLKGSQTVRKSKPAATDTTHRRAARDEKIVRAGFWTKVKKALAGLPFAEDLLAAYYCAFDAKTPFHVRATLLGALAYFVLPFDFIPDMLPLIGFTDDAAILATAIRTVASNLTPEHRTMARDTLADIREG